MRRREGRRKVMGKRIEGKDGRKKGKGREEG